MKKYMFLMAVVALFTSCAHMQTCDSYCASRGGFCQRIDHGSTRYNTTTGKSEEEPTYFVCKYSF